MTEDKGIFIRNVYYMLAYAFQELHMNNYEDIAKEEFEHIQDLFAEILYKGVSMQLKQGLYREYVDKSDNLPLVKGKININGTIKAMMQRKLLISCEFDELSEDNVFNRILKTTMIVLTYNDSVDSKRKAALKSLLPFFNNVETISPLAIQWNILTYKRNNRNYRMLMNICYFILDGMLLTTESGNYRMTTFSDDHMHRLYERFVLEYYRKHHPYISANSEKLSWDIDEDKPIRGIEFLPSMQTDIVLRKDDRALIIDTKYYGEILKCKFDKKAVCTNNMYQIFSYVKNMDTGNTGKISGMLLYAKTNEEMSEPVDSYFQGNRILVQTLDLNQEFCVIRQQLDSYISYI